MYALHFNGMWSGTVRCVGNVCNDTSQLFSVLILPLQLLQNIANESVVFGGRQSKTCV